MYKFKYIRYHIPNGFSQVDTVEAFSENDFLRLLAKWNWRGLQDYGVGPQWCYAPIVPPTINEE